MYRIGSALAVLVSTTTFLLSLAPTAVAGGGSWTFEGQRLNREAVFVPGEVVHAKALLWTKGVKPGEGRGAYWGGPEQGPYFGYISPRRGPRWGQLAPPVPPDSILLGQVAFTKTKEPGLLDVSLDFVMPDLEPGYYMLHHCNDPCSRQIGDTMSTPVTVVEDGGQAFLAARLQRLDIKLLQIQPRVQNRMDNLAERAAGLEREVEMLENKIGAIEDAAAFDAQRRGPSATPRRIEWQIVALGALLMSLFLVGARRVFEHRAELHFRGGSAG